MGTTWVTTVQVRCVHIGGILVQLFSRLTVRGLAGKRSAARIFRYLCLSLVGTRQRQGRGLNMYGLKQNIAYFSNILVAFFIESTCLLYIRNRIPRKWNAL